jgi:hypothetical protein
MPQSAYSLPPGTPRPTDRVRPGLVTAVGVASIVVGSICLVGGLASGFYVMGVQWIGRVAANQAQSRMASAAFAQQAAAAGAVGTGSGVPGVPTPDELERELAAERAVLAGRRDAVVDLLAGLQPMADDQRQELSAFVGRHAEQVVPPAAFGPAGLTAEAVRAWVLGTGSLPADAGGRTPPVFFRLAGGDLTVYADRAVYRPNGGGAGALRSAARDGATVDGLRFTLKSAVDPTRDETTPVGPATASATSSASIVYRSGLSEQDVEQAVAAIEANLSGNGEATLSTAQLATLRRELRDRVPALVSPGTSYQPARMVSNPPAGPVTLHLTNGSIVINAAGSVVAWRSNAVHQVTLSPVAGVLMIGEFFTSAVLAVFLLVAGILLLRDSPRAAGMHWLYALAKLPVAVLGGVTFAWVTTELSSGLGRLGGGPPSPGQPHALAWVLAVAAAAYPVVLLCVLPSRTVRDYLAGGQSLRGERG